MNRYSFNTGGFWFHLVQISNNSFQDQHGSGWLKVGNVLHSEGGCYQHQIKAEDMLGNKDYSQLVRQMQAFSEQQMDRYHYDRIAYCQR